MMVGFSIKKMISGAMAGLAAVGVTPTEVSDFLGVFFGLATGTIARWCYDRRNGDELPKSWLKYQIGMCCLIGIAVFWVAEAADLSGRLIPFVAGVGAFGVWEWLSRKKKQIEDGDIG